MPTTDAGTAPGAAGSSRTRRCGALRLAGAALALVAALGWALDRRGVLADPLAGFEEAAIGHPWWVVAGLAAVAAGCRLLDRLPTIPVPGRRASRRVAAPAELSWPRRPPARCAGGRGRRRARRPARPS